MCSRFAKLRNVGMLIVPRVAARCLLVASTCWRGRTPAVEASTWTPDIIDAVVEELNSVPVFAIRLKDEGGLS